MIGGKRHCSFMAESNGTETRRLPASGCAEKLVAQRSSDADNVVRSSFERHLKPAFEDGIAALAVGGFGRRELFPHSDVDVLVLTHEGLTAGRLREPLERFLRELWDAGLRVSHSVHTVQECCQLYEHNVELSVSLIDERALIGDPALLEQLHTALPGFFRLHGKSVARQLVRLTRFRHAKFQNTIYHLEPNIKDTPGGLRDLQVVRWFSKLIPGQAAADLDAAWRFLAPIRVFLHEKANRDDNLLTFEMQDAMSGQPEEMMRSYYRHARTVFATAKESLELAEESQPSLIRQFRDWRSRLSNSDFTVARERVFARSPSSLSDPEFVFRLLEFVGRHGVPASGDVERRICEAAPEIAKAAAKHPIWPQLKKVFAQPKASVAIRLMQNTGLLAALLPEWSHVDCLVVRDFYHRYTVDEHSLVAIETLENFSDRRFRDLAAEIDQPGLVRFALLMHDIGKGTGREHVAESDRLALQIGRRLGVPENDLTAVRQLIGNHLLLSSLMNSRDLDDARTAHMLADKAGTVEHLKMLALLTYCDISAVNPVAMTPWRTDQLWRTYILGYRELTRELDSVRIHDFGGADAGMSDFLEGLPNRYLRTHEADQIRAHAALASEAAKRGAAVDLFKREGYWEIVVAAPDRPFLFSSIAGALAAFGMNILKAEAFANSRGMILDTFSFADPVRTLELNPTEVDRLRDTVAKVVTGKQDVKRLLAGRRQTTRRPHKVAPRVAFDNEASQSATLIEIVAEDRPGLLYDLTSTMSIAGCDIVVVLIDTEASKALDVFYVTSGGAKLDSEKENTLRAQLMAVCDGGSA